MKRLLRLVIPVYFLVTACSPQNMDENSIPDKPAILYFKWLCGTWKFNRPEGTMYEIWERKNDTVMTGKGFFISGNDTSFSEKLELLQKGNDLFYAATVSNQNQGLPVLFKYSGIKNEEYVFANKEHDFPQLIIYKNPQPDFLCVRIEGENNGKLRKEDFNLLKVK